VVRADVDPDTAYSLRKGEEPVLSKDLAPTVGLPQQLPRKDTQDIEAWGAS
jgi:hypothetical protein